MLTGTALRIVRASRGLESPPELEDLEKFINGEMPGEFFALLAPVTCGPSRGKEITVCNPGGEIVHRFYSCSPAGHSLSTVKWIAGKLEAMEEKAEAGEDHPQDREDPLHAHVEQRIRNAAAGSGEPPGLRTMADFIDDHLEGCRTQLVKGQCGNGSVHLKVKKGGVTEFEFSTCLPGSDRRKLAQWITRLLDEQQT